MKNIMVYFILLCLISCGNDDEAPCKNMPVTFTSLENEYGCVNTKYQTEIGLLNDFVIIRNQTEFNNQVSGTCQPLINFMSYDLIIGKQNLTSGNSSIDYNIVENCETESIEIDVTFNQNSTTEAPNLTYHVLLPKIDNNQEVLVTIEIN